MEAIVHQRQLLNGSIATLFNTWERQLREKINECVTLRNQVETLQNTLELRDAIITEIRNESDYLRQKVDRIEATPISDNSPKLKALIEKHNNLYKDHELLKSTAAANQNDLIKQLRREREKLRSWNRFSSPGLLSTRLPNAAASDPDQNQRDQNDGPRAPITSIRDENHTFYPTHVPENVLNQQDEINPPRNDEIQSKSNDRGSLDTLAGCARDTNKLNLIEGPRMATEVDSSFVDAHPQHASRIPSPELPSLPGSCESSLGSQQKSPVDEENAVSEGSLPQIRHSDSTEAPSECLSNAGVGESSVGFCLDSDYPEFLGARCVKKNASTEVSAIGQPSAGNQAEPVTIKSDPDTSFVASRPVQFIGLASSMHESLDPSASRFEQRSPRKHRPAPRLPAPSAERSSGKSLATSQSLTSQRATSEPFSPSGPSLLRDQRSVGRRPSQRNAESTPLRQIDGNARNGTRNAELLAGLKSKKRKHDESRGAEAIATISEDGETFTTKARKTAKDHTASPQVGNPLVHQRLDDLLNGLPMPKEFPLEISRETIQEMDKCLSLASLSKIVSQKLPYDELLRDEYKDWEWWNLAKDLLSSHDERAPEMPLSHPRKQQRRVRNIQNANTPGFTPKHMHIPIKATPAPTPKSNITISRSPAPTPSSHTPYRSLSLSSLNLAHFKLNPAANHNLDYAFTDVVRNQAARKCLPGCTHPECCGPKFTALAKTLPQPQQQNAHITKKQNPTTPSSANQPRTALPSIQQCQLNPADLSSDLLQDRTTDLANKYGKAHRALHARPPSPPGFWNVDFPATQEREEDRAEAERREREEVHRRWRVSLKNADPRTKRGQGLERQARRGEEEVGLWMFADE
jgi:DNA repair protein endonuclease SAE2/CtIP C-terminus